ncbi:MAG: penicillin-binding protein 2 [Lachnospiraceae bacterium]|nr:penicillin-binding protein 2 [Lachnospiraceae bacterium]
MPQRKRTKREPKQSLRNNREITGVTVGVVALFLVMMGYFTVYAMTHQEELMNNSYNNRQQILTAQNRRGSIYARGGEALAETAADADGTERREYPYANLFAHAVGYVDKGKTGIEAQENYTLIRSSIPAVDKVKEEIGGKKNPGDNVYTTFDVKLQEAASKALGIYRGAVIAMDPKTGEILAMVSKPDFDPNKIAEEWDKLLEEEESAVLLNRATQGLYPPGSTFKIVTALEYIRENPDTYQNYHFSCKGSFGSGEDVINCYHGSKHGAVDLKKSFAKSCNSSFANIGLALDKKQFAQTLDKLLFNRKLPLSGVYNESKLEIAEDESDGEMMQNAIGQGRTQITPVHLALITAAVANDGVLMKPRMISRIESGAGVKLKEYSAEKYGALMSAEEAAVLQEYMEAVVEEGTATKLSGLSYTAAGKTGSAEYSLQKEESHAWFTGYAPAEDPQLVVTVIIEGAGSGGDYAVPMARRVFDAYLKTDAETD